MNDEEWIYSERWEWPWHFAESHFYSKHTKIYWSMILPRIYKWLCFPFFLSLSSSPYRTISLSSRHSFLPPKPSQPQTVSPPYILSSPSPIEKPIPFLLSPSHNLPNKPNIFLFRRILLSTTASHSPTVATRNAARYLNSV